MARKILDDIAAELIQTVKILIKCVFATNCSERKIKE
jgi:hypothetical protein